MKNVLKINLLVVIVFCFSYLLYKIGVPYLLYLAGLAVFFLPGLNIAWFLESLATSEFGLGKLAIWSFYITPFYLPLASYIAILRAGSLSEATLLSSVFGAILLSILLFLISKLFNKGPVTGLTPADLKKTGNGFFISILVLLTFMAINFLLYKYIPEADGYGYMERINKFLAEGAITTSNLSRPLFYSYVLDLMALTKIPIFWLFKVVLPLLGSLIFAPFFLTARRYFRGTNLVFASLLPFYFPVVTMEILYPRPQLIFISSLVFAVYLIIESCQKEGLIPLLSLIAFAFIGTKYHEFFMLLFLIAIVGFIIAKRKEIIQKPSHYAAGAIILFAIAYPWMRDMKLFQAIFYFFKPFAHYTIHPKLNMWFIDSYVNTDGNPMGWPGLSWILYYGYNLGLVFPVVAAALLLLRGKFEKSKRAIPGIVIFTFILFFAIAEVYPRLGLAFLPDRAWLFVALMLAYISLLKLADIKSKIVNSKIWIPAIIVLMLCSFTVSWCLTYQKQGWVTKNERSAAQFIKDKTPADSIIITQGTNDPLINFFAERYFLMPPGYLFMEANAAADNYYYGSIPELVSHKSQLSINKVGLLESSIQVLNELKNEQIPERVAQGKIIGNLEELEKTNQELARVNKEHLDASRPVYILYSKDKFKTLNNSREWFQKSNFYGADLTKFSEPRYTLVYQANSVYIWRVNEY